MADEAAARCPQFTAAFGGTLGAFIWGTYMAWHAHSQEKIPDLGFDLDDDDYIWVGSLFTLGGAIGCIPIGVLNNIIGRKWTMLSLSIPFIISWLMIICASNFEMLCFGLFIGGVACGGITATAPIYTAEISEQGIRGINGAFFQLNIALGVFYACLISVLCHLTVFSILCILIPIVFVAFLYMLPESPLFLLAKGRQEGAEKAMLYLRGPNYSTDGELAEMQDALEKYPISINPFKAFSGFKWRASRRGLFISLCLMLFEQGSGINIVLFYAPELLFEATENFDEFYSILIVAAVYVIGSFATLFFVDFAGRRIPLIVSGVVMAFCTFTLGIYYYSEENDPESIDDLGWMTVLAVCLFMLMFSFGFGPIPWLMLGELFAPDIRALCVSLSVAFRWLLSFLITFFFVKFRSEFGVDGCFWIYTGASLIGALFVYFFVPETKQISLDDIHELLEK